MKKNVYLSKVLTATLLITAGLSPEVRAQFDKYKSKTKFTKPAKTNLPGSPNTPRDIAIPDTGKSANSFLKDTTNFAPGDDEDSSDGEGDDVADEGSDSFEDASSGGSSGGDAFGRKRTAGPLPTRR